MHLEGWDVSLPEGFEEWGLIPGLATFGVWCGGMTFTTDFVQRLRLGALGFILGMLAAKGIGHVVSLPVEESARADVQIGVYGVLEVLVAGVRPLGGGEKSVAVPGRRLTGWACALPPSR
ncbi:hypothetical protein C8D87_101884 [Lentzea atacamensis]|uniref:Uncharacterized protein n=1 Tax=Lentzea atacamensis TaxID=531938 RepID=A0ABX9EK93_9PSEU|nr:hypothetical protein [Lentzea atacamensis]RAS70584.1 hypothetical protein C8D87_101884 [Lentzea atacamensis]